MRSAPVIRPHDGRPPAGVSERPDPPERKARPFEFDSPGELLYGVEGVAGDLSHRASARASAVLGGYIEADSCLERAAESLLRRSAESCTIWPSWLEEPVLHHAGCYDSGTFSFLFCTDDDDSEAALDEIEKGLAGVERHDFTHLGFSRRRGTAYRWVYAVLLTERRLELASFPRSIRSGERLVLEGSLTEYSDQVTAYHMDPSGSVTEIPVRRRTVGEFSVPVTELRTSGEHWLELMVSDRSGPHIGALFPVYVEVAVPIRVDPPPPVEMEASTPEEAEILLYELVNLERGQRGLPLLHHDSMLSLIARNHARAMRDSGFFAHLDPLGRGPRERAEQERYRARVIGENLARSPRISTAHEDLMGSPTHRANLLDPRFTNVGIGVVAGEMAGGRQFWVVENFSLPQRELSAEAADAEARARLLLRLDDMRASPERDRDLDAVAQTLSGEDPSTSLQYLNQRASRMLRQRRIAYREQVLIRQVLSDPADLQELPSSVWDKDRYGLAVRVDRPAGGSIWQYVVIIVLIR